MPNRMACIPVRDTTCELALRAALGRIGATPHRIDVGGLPGRPDVVLRKEKAALFAHGCFWHHHEGCRCARLPNTHYPWAKKFSRTRARDVAVRAKLIDAGWRVMWVWECGLIGSDALPMKALDEKISVFLKGDAAFLEIRGNGLAKPVH